MKNPYRNLYLFGLFLLIGFHAKGLGKECYILLPNEDTLLDRNLVQLMVVPNLHSYQAIKERLTKDKNFQIALNLISKTLEDQGYLVKDFIEQLNVSETKYALQNTVFKDPFEFLIHEAPVEAFIYFDLNIFDYGATESSVGIQLTVKDKYTAERLATSQMLSSFRRRNFTTAKLIQEALRPKATFIDFITTLDKKFIEMRNTGKKISVRIESQNTAYFPLDTILNKKQAFHEIVINWISHKSYKGYKKNIGLTPRLINLEVSIPVFKETNDYYTPMDFGLALEQFIKSQIGDDIDVELKVIQKYLYLYIN